MQDFSPSPYYFQTGLWRCIKIVISIPWSVTNHLQQVQNCAARLMTHIRKREHITSVLFQLHWLPVRFRSLYKILFRIFKVLSGTAPHILSDLIEKYIPVRMLRSDSYSLLRVPKKPYINVRREIPLSSSPKAVE